MHDGDISVLADYDQHGRLTGGDPETVMDQLARDYLAYSLNGTDVLVMAADHARRAELSRRIRDELITAAMDNRQRRIGEHAARHPQPWAVTALGPVPADRAGRTDWEQRAAVIGGYRELAGYHDPGDPIGPEPAADSPDKRAAWHAALAVTPACGTGVRGLPDGMLWQLRLAPRTLPAVDNWS